MGHAIADLALEEHEPLLGSQVGLGYALFLVLLRDLVFEAVDGARTFASLELARVSQGAKGLRLQDLVALVDLEQFGKATLVVWRPRRNFIKARLAVRQPHFLSLGSLP